MGKKSKKKKKKPKETPLTWREALLEYQISNKEKSLDIMRYELRNLEEQNKRALSWNKRLEREQTGCLDKLLKQAKDRQKEQAKKPEINRSEVIDAMIAKWNAAKCADMEISGLKKELVKQEKAIIREQKELYKWNLYKEHGCNTHKQQITLLQQELLDMQTSFTEIRGYLGRTHEKDISDIADHTEGKLDKVKRKASENAISKMDRNSRQEVDDNEWLKRELEMHKTEGASLTVQVIQLEKTNLANMRELFEHNVDDLKITRNFYLDNYCDKYDGVDPNNLLMMDLDKMSLLGKEDQLLEKYDTMTTFTDMLQDKELTSAPPFESMDFSKDDEVSYKSNEDIFNSLFQMANDDYREFLQQHGPLELKLLNIDGKSKPIHDADDPDSVELEEIRSKASSVWPVTVPMLKGIAPKST